MRQPAVTSRALRGALGIAVLAVLLVVLRPDPGAALDARSGRDAAGRATAPRSAYDVVTGPALAQGSLQGTRVVDNQVVLAGTATQGTAGGKPVLTGSYTTPWITPANAFTQLVPSWRAATGPGTWIEVLVQVTTRSGTSSWDRVARWSSREDQVRRTSYDAQTDDLAKMNVDTLVSQAGSLTRWKLAVRLYQRPGAASPTLRRVGAVATLPGSGTMPTSSPLYSTGKVLAVPTYSQMIHRGHYPQYGGGGEAWCSPTSLAMILGYYGKLPPASQYTWVAASYPDRWVDHVARLTYDVGYQGTGNWPFNTAIGGYQVGDGFVTRLASLRDAERFIRAGIPLAASIAFGRGQLPGAPISSSNGHLLVIVGFTAKGDVVVNDPAASTDGTVRRTYGRAAFEKVWQQASLGTVYVVRDTAHPLPEATTTAW